MQSQPMEVKRQEYNEKVEAFRLLRERASALRVVRRARDNLQTWVPSTREGTAREVEKVNTLGRDIGAVVNYFDNHHSGALECIHDDKFRIRYQAHYDINRQAVLGQNTVTINVDVEWLRLNVACRTYAGSMSKIKLREQLVLAAREGIPDRDALSKATGWSRDEVRQVNSDNMQRLKDMLSECIVGQNKMTRLVKGFLLLMEVKDRGYLDVQGTTRDLTYHPDALSASYQVTGRSYVYNSRPSSESHTAVLSTMCGAYPPPQYNSHVTIPADGDEVYMVRQGQARGNQYAVRLSVNLVYASLVRYSIDTSCSEMLQEAMCIACSLQQNRYFSMVELPKVSAAVDLMGPALVRDNVPYNKPTISRQMAVSLGRLHQMMSFLVAKDIITAANLKAKSGFDPVKTIEMYLNSNSGLVERMSEYVSSLRLLEMTRSMKLFRVLKEEDYADISTVSIFEGLWLANNAKRVVHNGIVSALMDGEKDLSGSTTTYDVMVHELQLAMVRIDDFNLPVPTGSFSVGWVDVNRARSIPGKPNNTIRKAVKYTQDCEYVPVRVPRKAKTRFYGAGGLNSLPPVNPRKGSDPPSYKAESRRPSEVSEPVVIESSSVSPPSTQTVQRNTQASEGVKSPIKLPMFRQQKIANEAVTARPKFNFSSLRTSLDAKAQEDAMLDEQEREEITRKVGNMMGQLSPEEETDRLLKSANLTAKERGEWLELLGATLGFGVACLQSSMDRLVDKLEKQGIRDYPHKLHGNNKWARVVNHLIEAGNEDLAESSLFNAMREKKNAWYGTEDDIDKKGLRFIAKSRAWERILIDRDVEPGLELPDVRQGKNKFSTAANVIADTLSRCEYLSISNSADISAWLYNCTVNMIPSDIQSSEVKSMIPDALPWRSNPTSLGPREFSPADSRWLVLASRFKDLSFDKGMLIKLKNTFQLERNMFQDLSENYGI